MDNSLRLAYLNEVTDYFGLGNVIDYSCIENGRNSQNYYIRTYSSGEFVVRILHDSDKIRLLNEIALQRAIKNANLHAISLEASSDGSYVFKKSNAHVTVARYMSGTHPDESSPLGYIKLIGEALGSFHARVDSTIDLNNRYLFVGNTRRNERLWYLSSKHKVKVVDLFLSTPLIEENRKHLPVGVLHGDLHTKNIIVWSKRAYMLDFQSVGIGPYILDIGRSIADVCRSGREVDKDKVAAFLEGYMSMRSLNLLEKRLINESITFGAGCVALWAYQKGVEELGDDMVSLAHSVLTLNRRGFHFL